MKRNRVIKTRCSCGEKLNIELEAGISARKDRKRPHYNNDHGGTTVFRYRKCNGWLGDTCEQASLKKVRHA